MQYIGQNLCLEYRELVPSLLSKSAYDKARTRGNITVHGYGGNGRNVYIEYESMPPNYRDKVVSKYGDPYQYAAKQPILDAIEHNAEAREYYLNYQHPDGMYLQNSDLDLQGKPQINHVARYSQAAEWMDMIIRLTSNKQALKKELNMSVMKFWEVIIELIKGEGVDLPKTRKHLTKKIKRYQSKGYASLIELHKWGNCFTKKVDEERLKAFLRLQNYHDSVEVADEYNTWAKENGSPTIDASTVSNYQRKWWRELIMYRNGEGAAKAKLKKKIKRKRPSAPLLKIESDDNLFDVAFNKPETSYYRDGKRKISPKSEWFRPLLYVVWDDFNDLPLGYAVGYSPTKQLILDAYRDAARYVRKLTGDHYCWQQVQTDRWGIGNSKGKKTELQEFYESMATYTPAQLKNPFSKYVERGFGVIWHKKLRRMFPKSYLGQNIDADLTSVNRDALNPKEFPHINEAPLLIANFIESLRNSKRTGCDLTREQEWLEAFHASDQSKKKLLSPVMYLEVFGKLHVPKNGKPNSIDHYGVSPTLMGRERCYELSQQQILKHIGKKVRVKYDEHDLSRVLLTDGKGLRLLAHDYELSPSAIADYEPGDADKIRQRIDEGNSLIPSIKEWAGDPDNRLLIEAQTRLQAGVMVKEINHHDQRALDAGNSVSFPFGMGGECIELPVESGGDDESHAQNDTEQGGVRAEMVGFEPLKKPLKRFKSEVESIYDEM